MTADEGEYSTSFKDRGNDAFNNKEYQKAVDLYTEGIENEPSNAILFSNRSAAYLKLLIYDKAKRDADMCIQLDEKWSKGWWRKGQAEIENQEYKSARSTFNEGLKHCPGDSYLVSGIEKANKYIAAVESYRGEPIANEYDINGPAERIRVEDETEDKTTTTTTSDKTVTGNNDKTKHLNNEGKNSKDGGENKDKQDESWPGTAAEEIERIKTAPNHYAILHVSGDASAPEMKKNYYTLAKLLHPDRCQLDGAGEAMTSVSQAYDTLSNVLKKTFYDQFLQQSGGEQDAPNQTYQEWESRQQPVEIPKWLKFVLGIRGCGFLIVVLFAIVCIPVLIVFVVVYILVTLICLPVSCFFRVFFPERYARMKEREEREMAKMEEDAQDRMFP